MSKEISLVNVKKMDGDNPYDLLDPPRKRAAPSHQPPKPPGGSDSPPNYQAPVPPNRGKRPGGEERARERGGQPRQQRQGFINPVEENDLSTTENLTQEKIVEVLKARYSKGIIHVSRNL